MAERNAATSKDMNRRKLPKRISTTQSELLGKSSNGPQVRAVTSAWDEHTVTWKNRPSVGSTVVANIGSVAAGKWVTYDVSPLVRRQGR